MEEGDTAGVSESKHNQMEKWNKLVGRRVLGDKEEEKIIPE